MKGVLEGQEASGRERAEEKEEDKKAKTEARKKDDTDKKASSLASYRHAHRKRNQSADSLCHSLTTQY